MMWPNSLVVCGTKVRVLLPVFPTKPVVLLLIDRSLCPLDLVSVRRVFFMMFCTVPDKREE